MGSCTQRSDAAALGSQTGAEPNSGVSWLLSSLPELFSPAYRYLGDGRFHLESVMIANPRVPAYRYWSQPGCRGGGEGSPAFMQYVAGEGIWDFLAWA